MLFILCRDRRPTDHKWGSFVNATEKCHGSEEKMQLKRHAATGTYRHPLCRRSSRSGWAFIERPALYSSRCKAPMSPIAFNADIHRCRNGLAGFHKEAAKYNDKERDFEDAGNSSKFYHAFKTALGMRKNLSDEWCPRRSLFCAFPSVSRFSFSLPLRQVGCSRRRYTTPRQGGHC